MKRVENVLIDLKSNNYRELILKQMDSTQLIFFITENGKNLSLENVDANLIFTKPNGRVVIQDSEISIIENRIKIDLIPDCVRDYGKGIIEVELKENNEVVSTFQLICKIEKTGKDFTPSSNNDNYYEKIEKILNELQTQKDNGDFNGLSAYEEAVSLGFKGTKEEWLISLKGADFDEEKLNKKLEKYEEKHNYYQMTINELIAEETEVEIPCNYIVGNDELIIYYNGDRLLCEKSEDDEANYREVGQAGDRSKKVIFGWNLRIGDVLDFIVKGVVENNEESEN